MKPWKTGLWPTEPKQWVMITENDKRPKESGYYIALCSGNGDGGWIETTYFDIDTQEWVDYPRGDVLSGNDFVYGYCAHPNAEEYKKMHLDYIESK